MYMSLVNYWKILYTHSLKTLKNNYNYIVHRFQNVNIYEIYRTNAFENYFYKVNHVPDIISIKVNKTPIVIF